ncbi:MAG: helix-turn-helix domain-containing protein, partial [Lachnospiraceae bacterium]
MNQYVTGAIIRKLREAKAMTQQELAAKLSVSDKTISKWETGKGYPDITLIEPIAAALGISTIELLSGEDITNHNRASNMLRTKLYVCPICGNILTGTGEAVISCCGLTLPPLEAEPTEGVQPGKPGHEECLSREPRTPGILEAAHDHRIMIRRVEDEYYVTMDHEMTKSHFISFFAAVSQQGIQVEKMYPEGNAQARFKINRTCKLYAYCNRHG